MNTDDTPTGHRTARPIVLALIAGAVFAIGCGTDDIGLGSNIGDGKTCEDFQTLATPEQDDIAHEMIEDSGEVEATSFSVGLIRTSLQAFCSNPSNSSAQIGDISIPFDRIGGGQ